MKKVFTLIAMALVTMGVWAETKTVSPAAEMAFRTAGTEKDVETVPTKWQSGFPKSDQATIECTYSQRMWAQQMFDELVKTLSRSESLTEDFKATAPMEWVRKSNNIRNRAAEIVNQEVIFS